MTFQEAVRTCLTKYATFRGRARRPEYWWFVLFVFLAQFVAGIVDAILFPGPEAQSGPVGGIVTLALLLPTLAAGARRLHDIGRSGWWLLLGLVPIVGTLVLLWWFVQPSREPEPQDPTPDATL